MGTESERNLRTRLDTCAATLCAGKVIERLAACSVANRPASHGALLRFIRGAVKLRAHVLDACEVVAFLIAEGFENQEALHQAQSILKACDAGPRDIAKLDEQPDAKLRILRAAKLAHISALSLPSLAVWILSQSHLVISVSSNAVLEQLLVNGCVEENPDGHLDYNLCLDKLIAVDAQLFTERSVPSDALRRLRTTRPMHIFEMHPSRVESPSPSSCTAESSVKSFEDLGLNETLIESLHWHGLQNPSEIQQRCLLPLLQGRDVVAQARSGTGKTAALAIAAIQQIDHSSYEGLEQQQRCPSGHCFKKVFAHKPCRVWEGCKCAGCEDLEVPLDSPKAGDESKNPCAVCGCSSEFDSSGDRICWCDSCWHGCGQWQPQQLLLLLQLLQQQGVHCKTCSWYLCRNCHEQQAGALLQQVAIPKCQAVIAVPTRELANQIHQTIIGLGRGLDVRCHVCAGGTSVRVDIDALRTGQHIVVGSPGRLFDMISKRHLKVDGVKLFLMDEWDALASDNMKNQIYDVFKCLPPKVQCGVFSTATPPDILHMTTQFMRDPANVLTKDHLLMPAQVRHFYLLGFDGQNKTKRLLGLAGFVNRHAGVIVFCNSRREVDVVTEHLVSAGVEAGCLHAELDQKERDLSLRGFRKRSFKVLVCTNEFGRGLNIPHVRLVVNYDVPSSAEDYLLRSGRCGRFGRCGSVITFVSNRELPHMKGIAHHYSMHIEETSMGGLQDSTRKVIIRQGADSEEHVE